MKKVGILRIYTVGAKSMSPVDTELLFAFHIANINALHHNPSIFAKSSNLNK